MAIALTEVGYSGAATATGGAVSLPPGWSGVKLALGQYRVTHNLRLPLYVVFCTIRDVAKGNARAFNYQQNTFDVNTFDLPTGADADHDFGFILVRLP